MRRISVLGSTGSIGKSTLDVVLRHPDRFSVVALAEGHDVEEMAAQVKKFRPRLASVRNREAAEKLRSLLGSSDTKITFGMDGAVEAASHPDADVVLSAIVGAAGLSPTVAAIEAGKLIALANKETMVVAGELVSSLAAKRSVKILPVDSEHSAVFQSLAGHRKEDLRRIILTASGGPFLRRSRQEIEEATPEEALKHPKWSMGAKITIDSASLMNKGLEVIEARWLFSVAADQIDVLVHPQSIVHSIVEYNDGCMVAEMGVPDMRAPISYAISYPERVASGAEFLDLKKAGQLTFEEPDWSRFPALTLAYDALEVGRSMPCVLNAANEVAVQAFLDGKMKFGAIPRVVSGTMEAHEPVAFSSVSEILEVDSWARAKAKELVI